MDKIYCKLLTEEIFVTWIVTPFSTIWINLIIEWQVNTYARLCLKVHSTHYVICLNSNDTVGVLAFYLVYSFECS